VPADVPAGAMPEVRKQRVHAHFVLRVEVDELGLAVLERDGVVRLDLHRARGSAAQAHRRVIARVQQRNKRQHNDDRGFHV